MRILVNHSNEDSVYRQPLTFMLQEHGLTGVATTKTYDISTLQETAKKANCQAVLLTHPETLKALLGEKATLDKYRGTRINYSIPIIVANPLEHIHTVTYGKWLLKQDLRKFKRIKEPVIPFDFTVADTQETQEQAFAFLEQCLLISFDVETDEAPQMTCISFTGLHPTGRVECFIVPIVDFGVVHYRTEDELAQAICFIRRVQALEAAKVAFNGIYDSQYNLLYNAGPNNYYLDAMVLGWAEYSELPRALEFQASLHCFDYFFWKDESDEAKKKKDIRSYWAYCCKDSWYTLRVLLSQLTDLKDYQIFNYKETFKLEYPALYCAFEGILVDVPKRAEYKKQAEAKRAQKLVDLQKITATPEFNPGSWQQVSTFIYEIIGAKKPERTKGAGTDAKTLNRVSMQHPLLSRICDLIITYREEAKAISTYCDFELLNGRLMYGIDPSGTETMRAASKASSFWVGTQIQNIPSYAKTYLKADPGFALIEADKNKSEARCVAYLSRCEALIEDLENLEKDFYKVVTERFFNIPYDQVTKEMRNDVTKHIIHGTHHCMGPEPFIDTATPQKVYQAMVMLKTKTKNMSEFVKYLLSLYHIRYPEVRKFWNTDVRDKIVETNKTVSPLGWTRYFFGNPVKNHGVFREGVAHQSQNLSVHIINKEEWSIYQELVIPSNGEFRLKAQIHDSIFAQARIDKLEHYAKRMYEIMTRQKIRVHGRTMLLPVDIKIGTDGGYWSDLKEVKFG